jgi:hypothetical protein
MFVHAPFRFCGNHAVSTATGVVHLVLVTRQAVPHCKRESDVEHSSFLALVRCSQLRAMNGSNYFLYSLSSSTR